MSTRAWSRSRPGAESRLVADFQFGDVTLPALDLAGAHLLHGKWGGTPLSSDEPNLYLPLLGVAAQLGEHTVTSQVPLVTIKSS